MRKYGLLTLSTSLKNHNVLDSEFFFGSYEQLNDFKSGFFWISDEYLADKNFIRSTSQPEIMANYLWIITLDKNPILECLADQARQDPDWPDKNCSGSSVLDTIIEALESHGLLNIILKKS